MAVAASEQSDALLETSAIRSQLAKTTKDTLSTINTLHRSLQEMGKRTNDLTQYSKTWHALLDQHSRTLSRHANIAVILEAPQLVEEAVRSGAYAEAIAIHQHTERLASLGGLHRSPGFIALRRSTTAALQRSVTNIVLPRLAGPLSMEVQFRLIQFCGLVAPRTHLPSLFLAARSESIAAKTEEAAQQPTPFARALLRLQMHRTEVSEGVLVFVTCFPPHQQDEPQTDESMESGEEEAALLMEWVTRHTDALYRDFVQDVNLLSSSYELGQLWEQSQQTSLAAARTSVSMRPLFDGAILQRATVLFTSCISSALEDYEEAMAHFSWRPMRGLLLRSALTTPHASPNAAAGTPGSGTLGSSSSSSAFNRTATSPQSLLPPSILTDFVPLARVLNGFLKAINTVHHLLLPGMERVVLRHTSELLQRMARAFQKDGEALLCESSEVLKGFAAGLLRFLLHFIPHVMKCIDVLLGSEAVTALTSAMSPAITMLEELQLSVERLSGSGSPPPGVNSKAKAAV